MLGLVAAPALAAAVPACAQAPIRAPGTASTTATDLRLRTVVIDATRVAALGNPGGADRLAVVLAREMRKVFADLMAPHAADGATLVARISSLYFVPFAGGRDYGGSNSSGSGSDSLDGVGIVTSGGRALSQTPILAILDPGYSGAWYLPNIDELRLDSISYQFAWWLRREMGV